MDRSHARRYVMDLGFEFVKVRTPESGNQVNLAVSIEDADRIVQKRRDDGYLGAYFVKEEK